MKVTIYSDGACKGNPNGPGGFGTILQYVDRDYKLHEKEFSAGYKSTTNNRMELMGVITGFEALKTKCDVEVISDSKYVCDAFNKGWIYSWMKKGWKKSDNEPVKNRELWERLLKAMDGNKVTFTWIKGHAGHRENERCDTLASNSAKSSELLDDDGLGMLL